MPRRRAIADMIANVMPFSIFYNLSSTWLEICHAPFQLRLDGIDSQVTIPGIYELGMTPMTNPVAGQFDSKPRIQISGHSLRAASNSGQPFALTSSFLK